MSDMEWDLVYSSESEEDCFTDSEEEPASNEPDPEPGEVKVRREIPFIGRVGARVSFDDATDPLKYFNMFFDDEVVDHIMVTVNERAKMLKETNTFSEFSRFNDWTDTTSSEIRAYLAVLILQSIIHKPRESWYWAKRPILATPIFSSLMSSKRYSLITKCIYFSSETSETEVKLGIIQEAMVLLSNKFQSAYEPECNLGVEESLIQYRSKSSLVQVKLFRLNEVRSGYICRFFFYAGKSASLSKEYSNYSLETNFVMSLLHGLLGKGHCVTIKDCLYSAELFKLLFENNTDVHVAVELSKKKSTLNKKMCESKFKDESSVDVESVAHSSNSDLSDGRQRDLRCIEMKESDNSVYTPYTRKKHKIGYKNAFRHVLDMSISNSFVLYRKNGGVLSRLDFRVRLAEELFHRFGTLKKPGPVAAHANALRFVERHFPSYVPITGKSLKPCRRCVVCSNKRNESGKRIRRETRYWCEQCQVGLCAVPCFGIYHTEEA